MPDCEASWFSPYKNLNSQPKCRHCTIDLSFGCIGYTKSIYARCQIEARATSTAEKMTLTKPDSTQASIGLISIQNASLNQKQTVAMEAGDYCEISNNVAFAISGSAGVNLLKRLISISISGGDNWTQKAIIRAHKTSAYGIVWTLGDVYKI